MPPSANTDGGPYTSHGHPVEGVTVVAKNPPPVARCGGPGICSECSKEANRISIAHAMRPETTDDWAEPHPCDNEHPEPLPAVAIVHIIGSNSAANATSLCVGCLVHHCEAWADEVQTKNPEAYRWEIRPVLPPPTDEDDDGRK